MTTYRVRCRVCGGWSLVEFETRAQGETWGARMMANRHPPKSGWLLGHREPFKPPEIVEVVRTG